MSKSPGVFVQGAAAATAINTHMIPQIYYKVTCDLGVRKAPHALTS